MSAEEWQQLRLKDAEDDPLVRLEKARDNEASNIAGWKRQCERMRAAGREPPTGLWGAIQEAEEEIERLSAEILGLARAEHDERQRAARRRYANGTRKLGEALPSNGEE